MFCSINIALKLYINEIQLALVKEKQSINMVYAYSQQCMNRAMCIQQLNNVYRAKVNNKVRLSLHSMVTN